MLHLVWVWRFSIVYQLDNNPGMIVSHFSLFTYMYLTALKVQYMEFVLLLKISKSSANEEKLLLFNTLRFTAFFLIKRYVQVSASQAIDFCVPSLWSYQHHKVTFNKLTSALAWNVSLFHISCFCPVFDCDFRHIIKAAVDQCGECGGSRVDLRTTLTKRNNTQSAVTNTTKNRMLENKIIELDVSYVSTYMFRSTLRAESLRSS